MLKKIGGIALILIFTAINSDAQVYDYKYGRRQDHAGVQFDLNQNMGSSMVDNDGTKSTFAPFFRLGAYAKRQIGKGFYVKGSVMLGTGNFSYNYTKTFESVSDTSFPRGINGRMAISVPVIEPEFAIGYLFKIRSKHQLDLRLGVSVPMYLSRYNNFSDTTYTKVNLNKGTHMVQYATTNRFQTNYSGSQWGMVNGTMYVGYKRVHYNDVSDRLGIGLVFGYTFFNNFAGVANYQAHDITYKYTMWDKNHMLTYLSAGIRIEYDIF